MAKVRIAVLFGGATKDHRLSLMSAYCLLKGLAPDKYDVTPIGITRAGRWLYFPGDYDEIIAGTWEESGDCCSAIISPDPLHAGIITIMADGTTAFKRVDVVMSALHGKYGEDGRIQGLLKLSKIPYVECNPETAVYCMDKALTHLLLSTVGLDVPKYALLERSEIDILDRKIEEIEREISYPVFVSATSCSSSIGANMASNTEEMKKAAKIAFSHHHTVIVEEDLEGRTIECVVMGNMYSVEVSALGEIIKTPSDNPSVAYTAEFIVDPELTYTQRRSIEQAAKKAFLCLNYKGCCKMSFRLADNRVMLRRIATIPGYSPESVMPLLMKESGYSYSEAINRIISMATDIDV